MIRQGEIYWVDFGPPSGSGPALFHPAVVVQNDVFNASTISTVVVCLLTSNLALGQARGNVALAKGEANLTKRSVVNVSQLYTVDKTELGDLIGTLSRARLMEVLAGVQLVISPSGPGR